MQQELGVSTPWLLGGFGAAVLAGAGDPLPGGGDALCTGASLTRELLPLGDRCPTALREQSETLELLWWNNRRSEERRL